MNSHAASFDDIFRSIKGIELRFSGVVANIFLQQKKQTLHRFIATGSFQHYFSFAISSRPSHAQRLKPLFCESRVSNTQSVHSDSLIPKPELLHSQPELAEVSSDARFGYKLLI